MVDFLGPFFSVDVKRKVYQSKQRRGGVTCLRGTQEGNERVKGDGQASCTLKRDGSKGGKRG